MHADTLRMRTSAQGFKPVVTTNVKTLAGLTEVMGFI